MARATVRRELAPTSGQDTRERLLRTAESLFASQGYEGTSLRDIGKVMTMANASLLHHFPTKGQLYRAVLEQIADSLRDVATCVADPGDVDERSLSDLYDGFFDWCSRHPTYAQIVMRELLDNPGRVDRVGHWPMADAIAAMVSVIEKGQVLGTFRRCDPTLFLFHFVGSITYLFVSLPTISGITGRDRSELIASFRKETLDHLRRAILLPANTDHAA